MVHWHLDDAQSRTRRFHLHFQIPAVSFLAHVQVCERIAPDGAKRAHVRVRNAVKQLRYPSDNSPGYHLLEIHAAWFTLPARARSDHEIVRSTRDRFYKPRYERWNV